MPLYLATDRLCDGRDIRCTPEVQSHVPAFQPDKSPQNRPDTYNNATNLALAYKGTCVRFVRRCRLKGVHKQPHVHTFLPPVARVLSPLPSERGEGGD